jgi:hypothetical protein
MKNIMSHNVGCIFPHSHSGKAYTNILCENLLQVSNVVPSSNPGSSFAEMPNGGRLEHVNQFQEQPLELVSKLYSLMNMAPSAVNVHCSPNLCALLESLAIPSGMWHHEIFMGHHQIMEWKISMHERSNKPSIFGTTVREAIPTSPL